jgi:hypothetical protein
MVYFVGSLDSPVMNTPGSHDSSVETHWESITNMKNSLNIQTNLKSFLGMSNGTKKKLLDEKTSVKNPVILTL